MPGRQDARRGARTSTEKQARVAEDIGKLIEGVHELERARIKRFLVKTSGWEDLMRGLDRDMLRVHADAQRLLHLTEFKALTDRSRGLLGLTGSLAAIEKTRASLMSAAESRFAADALDAARLRSVAENASRIMMSFPSPAFMAAVNFADQLSNTFGPHLSNCARGIGDVVLDQTQSVTEEQVENLDLSGFVAFEFTATERALLYWLTAVTVSALMAYTAALSEEASRALTTLLGFLLLFLTVQGDGE